MLDLPEEVRWTSCQDSAAAAAAAGAADTFSTRTCTQVSCGVPNIGNGGGLAWALKELGLRNVERRVQWNEAAGMLKRYAGRVAKMFFARFGVVMKAGLSVFPE